MNGAALELSREHRLELARAYKFLEAANFATRLGELAGRPLESALLQIPKPLRGKVERAIQQAMLDCLKVAARSLDGRGKLRPRPKLAAAVVGLAGGAGGAFGAAGLPFELPFTTILMLRSIAEIARCEGEDLSKLEARLACLEVFAYGAERRADTGYYASRALLSRLTTEAAARLAQRGMAGAATPAAAALTGEVGTRFGIVVWERVAAGAVPLLGAAGAAAINVAFMSHFQKIARGHFILRRLERLYGVEAVRDRYQLLKEADRSRRKSPEGG